MVMARGKTWKKKIAIMLSAVVLLNPMMPLGRALTEEAHAASWAQPYLDNLVNRSILRGDENGDLRPDDNISRAEFAALVNRTFGFDEKGKTSFGDVKPGDWFADDISIAANQGFFAGMPSGALPNDPLTREQAVTMLCRAVKIPEKQIDSLLFSDSKSFQNWSKGSIYAAADKGIVNGFNDQTFRPQQNITRAEVAKILSDMSGEIVDTSVQERFGFVNGNVTLSESGAGLRNTTIYGDLYITEGVGAGYIILDNVTVLGDVIISGCGESNIGESSIVVYDCNFENVIIDVGHEKKVSLIAEGKSVIRNTEVKSVAYLEERNRDADSSAFENIQLNGPEKTVLDLAGEFNTVTIRGKQNELYLRKGGIDRLVVDELAEKAKVQLDKNTYVDQLYLDTGTEVTGEGEIDAVVVQTNGTKIEGLPGDITIRPGIIANINGKDMTYDDAERDKATPQINDIYPEIIDIKPNGATAVIKVNKPGKIYWMVKLPISNAPTEDNLLDPKKATGVVASGSFTIAADKEVNTALNGLLSGEEYVFYAMLEDVREDCSSIESEIFRTVDNVMPTMIAGYPEAEGVFDEGGHKLKYTLVPSKNGTIYWATLPKGSIAPTVDVLINDPLKVPGALDAGMESCTKNEVSNFFATGLEEATLYDTYMAIKDESGNDSKIYKLTTSTLDVTPPEFTRNYPKLGTITNNSVNMIYMTDETCTLYWAVYPRGTKVPSSYEDQTLPGGLYSPEAQQEVMTGNNALKAGKTNATVEKEGNFNISGLTVETPYDLYFVLVDKSGNKSCPVLKKEITTKDDIQPSVTVEFDPANVSDEGEPRVGSNIRLAFSEIVYSGMATTKTLLADVEKGELTNFIKLYDTSQTPRVEVPIDFSKATFTEEDGKTILTFTTAEGGDAAALVLASGNRYTFELSNVIDSVGNKMKTNAAGAVTRLEEFRTMAPFVELKDIGWDNNDYHIVFDVDPKLQNASPELVFDIIAETDKQITCTIEKVIDGRVEQSTAGISMQPGNYYSMQALLDKDVYADYVGFNDLKKTQYRVKVTNLEGIGEADSNLWNQKLSMDFRGVSGTRQNMIDTAFGSTNGSFDDVAASLAVSVVSDPLKLTCNKYFSDAEPPKFLTDYPKITAGDTSARVSYMTDKACTVYWLVVPEGKLNAMPDPLQLIEGSIRPDGSQRGTMQIVNGRVEFAEYIRELSATTKYEFYYTAKSNAASEVQMKTFMTNDVVTPQWVSGYPKKAGQVSGQAFAEVSMREADANIYWVCYEAGVRSITQGASNEITAEEIAGASISTDSKLVDSGEILVNERDVKSVTIRNLVDERSYDVFFVARNPLADPNGSHWSERAGIYKISAADVTPPTVSDYSTAITNIGGTPMIPSFAGEFQVTFSEPLYFVGDGSDPTNRVPFTSTQLKEMIFETVTPKPVSSGKVLQTDTIGTDGALKGFTISFTGARQGVTFKLSKAFYDAAGNKAGNGLVMTFVVDKEDNGNSHWDIKFV